MQWDNPLSRAFGLIDDEPPPPRPGLSGNLSGTAREEAMASLQRLRQQQGATATEPAADATGALAASSSITTTTNPAAAPAAPAAAAATAAPPAGDTAIDSEFSAVACSIWALDDKPGVRLLARIGPAPSSAAETWLLATSLAPQATAARQGCSPRMCHDPPTLPLLYLAGIKLGEECRAGGAAEVEWDEVKARSGVQHFKMVLPPEPAPNAPAGTPPPPPYRWQTDPELREVRRLYEVRAARAPVCTAVCVRAAPSLPPEHQPAITGGAGGG
jgi:hypothetical protein